MNMVAPAPNNQNNMHGDEDEGVYLNPGSYTVFHGSTRETLTVQDGNCFIVTHTKYLLAVKSAEAMMNSYGFDTTGFTPQQVMDVLLDIAFARPAQ